MNAMIITYLITRCHLDNPVKRDEIMMKVTSVFIKYLNYACKITWIEFLITLCLVKNSIQISKRKHSVTSRFIWLSHINNSSSCLTGISKHSKTMYVVFSYIVFECLDIPVKHSLSLFIYYMKLLTKLCILCCLLIPITFEILLIVLIFKTFCIWFMGSFEN
jgi:hypothetical protein